MSYGFASGRFERGQKWVVTQTLYWCAQQQKNEEKLREIQRAAHVRIDVLKRISIIPWEMVSG